MVIPPGPSDLPDRPVPDPAACPVRAAGLELRASCHDCTGVPAHGQRTVRRGATLFAEGTAADAFHLVVQGWIAQTSCTSDGQEQGLRLAGPGAVLGAEALFADAYASTARALSPARVCRVPVAEARRTLATDPVQGLALARLMASEVVALQSQILRVGALTASERLRETLERLCPGDHEAGWRELPVFWTDLATLLGLTPETISRVLRTLAADGVLETDGRRLRWSAPPTEIAVP